MHQRERASAVVIHEGKLLTVLLEDPHTKVTRHFPPGGKIEKNEDPAQTAIRETLEETGIEISLTPHPPHVIVYPFVWNNITYECTTSYFAGTCTNPEISKVDDADYNKGAEWIPLSKLDQYLGFDHQILSAVRTIARSAFTDT